MDLLPDDMIYEIMRWLGPDTLKFAQLNRRFWHVFEQNRAKFSNLIISGLLIDPTCRLKIYDSLYPHIKLNIMRSMTTIIGLKNVETYYNYTIWFNNKCDGPIILYSIKNRHMVNIFLENEDSYFRYDWSLIDKYVEAYDEKSVYIRNRQFIWAYDRRRYAHILGLLKARPEMSEIAQIFAILMQNIEDLFKKVQRA